MDGDSGDERNDELTCVRSDKNISLRDQQEGEVPWEADSRGRLMRDGNIFVTRQQQNQA